MIATDQALLEQALAGLEDAFTALYRRRQGGVYRFALQMTGSTAIAEDVTQETFLALLLHGTRYDQARGTVAAFLYGIARNLVMRRLERRPGAEFEVQEEVEECAGPEDLLEDLTRRESIEQVRQAVLSLPPIFREAVVLCDLQDSSYEEAAAALDCPVGTVRSRLNRGRAMLARKLRGAACAGRSIECSPKTT
jgi:RNA polymerase sigma-70 factor (ECF subfamily)